MRPTGAALANCALLGQTAARTGTRMKTTPSSAPMNPRSIDDDPTVRARNVRKARACPHLTRTTASILALMCGLSADLWAAAPRALPEGQIPRDARLEPLKDLDGYFPFAPADSKEAWARRAERVRHQIQVSLGLWPWP